MANVVIYTTNVCPYCVRAKMLLTQKGVEFQEINVSNDVTRDEMIAKSGGKRSVPQIFIGATHVGGSDELYALESEGTLNDMLAG